MKAVVKSLQDQKFKMKIHEIIEENVTELFQPGKDWKWSFRGSEEAVAVFYVGKIPYQFYAHGSNGEWEVSFKNAQRGGNRGTKFGLTGTGNSAEVMSTVVDIMRSFLDTYKDKISVLIFTAKEDSRQGLYAKMTKRLLPNWTLTQNGEYFELYAPKQDVTEDYHLDEGLGDWIEKKMDQLLGNDEDYSFMSPDIADKVRQNNAQARGDMVAKARAQAPANIPDDVAEKLVADFLAKKQNERLLQQAAEAQRTTVEKLKPYLMYFVGNFVDRWKRISSKDKQRIFKDLAMGVFRLIMFILEAMIKSKR